MERLDRILLHWRDGDEEGATLARVASLVERTQAAVDVVMVQPRPPWYARLVDGNAAAATAHHAEERKEGLHRLLGNGALSDHANIEVVVGDPTTEIVARAAKQAHGLIVTTSSNENSLFGRVEVQLVRKAPCPVWVLRRDEPKRLRRVLVAIKPDPDNPVGVALSRRLLETAAAVAEAEGAELHVVRVWGARLERLLERRMRRDRWEEVRDQLRREARSQVLGLIEPWVDQIGGRLWLRQGDPETVIPELVAKKKIDLLVIGTVARSGLEGVIIGNVAERVFETVRCSILTLRPLS
jgi:nucleotide-binding universal stress UspA family protein